MLGRRYLDGLLPQLARFNDEQWPAIETAGVAVADCIARGHRVWIAKTSHCLVDEATFRAGGLMAVHQLHDLVTIDPGDVVLAGTPAGTFSLAIDVGTTAKARGAVLIVLTQLVYETHPDILVHNPSGRRLHEMADIVIDLGGHYGDGEFDLEETGVRILPSSGITVMAAAWMIFAEAIERLIDQGKLPLMYQSMLVPGANERNAKLEAEYLGTHIGYHALSKS